jgi:hypothetical protein
MRKRPRQGVNARTVVLMVLAVIVTAGVLGSSGLAAQTSNVTTASTGQVTMLDPFALRMVTLANATSASSSQADVAIARLGDSMSWRPVRIPVRLPERSAFRPSYVSR